MPIINKFSGALEPTFRGLAQGSSYFEIKILDSTAFCNTDIEKNFKLAGASLPGDFSGFGPYYTFFEGDGFYVELSSGDADSGDDIGGFRGYLIDKNNHFDFRWKLGAMGVGDSLVNDDSGIIHGIIFNRDSPQDGGGFFAQMDSPESGIRRLQIKYARTPPGNTIVVFSETETSVGQFGPSQIANGAVQGYYLHSLRMARSGNRLLAEWNYYSDVTSFPGLDSDGLIKTYKHSTTFYPDNGFNTNNGSGAILGTDYEPVSYTRMVSGLPFTLNYFSVATFRSVPAISIDTTNESSFAKVLGYDGNSIRFIVDGHNEGYADIRVTQYNAGSVAKSSQVGDVFKFERKLNLSGHTTQFMYDNKLSYAKTNDLKTDLFVNSVYKFPLNKGSITPIIYTDIGTHRCDSTYSIYVNKDGYLSNFEMLEDNTDFNSINASDVKSRTKLIMGRNNPPSYLYHDSTYLLGRNAKFNFLDNVLLTAAGGETPVIDQYKVFERDMTSYYIMEVVSDGTFFIVYSRIFNPYTKTLSSRVRVNNDITVYARNPTYSASPLNTDWFIFSYNNYKPNPSIMAFPDKHICALTVNTEVSAVSPTPAGLAYRLFFETFNQGTSWTYKSQDNRNYGKAGETGYNGDTATFKIRNNDNYFFNFVVNANTTQTFFHRADNFAMRPSGGAYGYVDLLKFSRIADQTVFYISACYDPIQENIAVCLAAINGQVEIIRSPRVRKDTMMPFNLSVPVNSWKSENLTIPFSDRMVGKTYLSIDKAGDVVAVATKRNDDTSFAIMRTSQNKDDLNVMGRFIQDSQKISTRFGRQITNMFLNKNGDILMSSAGRRHDSASGIVVDIAKYGILTNTPAELDYDEGWLTPQLPELFSGTTHTFDTTTNGLLLPDGGWGYQSSGTTQATIHRPLSSRYRGFRSEWQSFLDPIDSTAYVGTSARATFRAYGNKLTATTSESHFFEVYWDITSVRVVNISTGADAGFFMDQQLFDARKLRRYFAVVERTIDNSFAGNLFTENLEMSNHDKIIWDKKLSWVSPSFTVTGTSDPGGFNLTTPRTIHVTYLFATRMNAPLHAQRNDRLNKLSEKIVSRSLSNLSDYNGIPATSDMTCIFSDGVKINWDGLDGVIGDRWNFTFDSMSRPNNLVDKEPFKSWRSVSDNTTNVVVFDATDQGFTLLRGNVAVFNNANFRRCFIEGANFPLLYAPTAASYSKEIFFDFDSGVVVNDATNYGNSCIIPCDGKSWRPNEHMGRFVQFEVSRLDGTAFRHKGFRIIENAQDSLTIFSGPQRFDTTGGMRYVICDGNQSVKLSDMTSLYNFWRIRIPMSQTSDAATPSDETAQGSLYREPYRELGEFDLGRITELLSDIDEDYDITIQSDVRTTEFDNMSTVNFEFARSRRSKRIKYSNGSNETMSKIKAIFMDLYGSAKTLWVFDDQEQNQRAFMLARIINEPEYEEVNDGIQSVSIELEEVI